MAIEDPRYKWRKENPEKYAEVQHRAYAKKAKYYKEQDAARYRLIRLQLFAILGSECGRCGFSDSRGLQVDHKEGGGNAEHRQFKSARNMYTFYVAHPDLARERLQVLCANCNWIKKSERLESPVKERYLQKLSLESTHIAGRLENTGAVCLWRDEPHNFLDGFITKCLN